MALLFITKWETWIFLSYECYPLIQDNVFHIFTVTATSNDTCEYFAQNVYSNCQLTNANKYSQCSFAAAICVEITYNTDNVSHQKSLNLPSVRIPISSPYIWLQTVFMNPVTTSMSGLLTESV